MQVTSPVPLVQYPDKHTEHLSAAEHVLQPDAQPGVNTMFNPFTTLIA